MTTFKINERVGIAPHHDLWMAGCRYATVTTDADEVVYVDLDTGRNVCLNKQHVVKLSDDPKPTDHVVLVAVQVMAASRHAAQRLVQGALHVGTDEVSAPFECWWIAEDDRTDGSDNDSAVFCNPGQQAAASRALYVGGFTAAHNVVERKGGQFA